MRTTEAPGEVDSRFPPPSNFIPAGNVVAAKASDTPAFIKTAMKRRRVKTGARRAGRVYERKVQKFLCEEYETYIPSTWLSFQDDTGRTRWCQPDGILLDYERGRLTIVEIKVTHTQLAWWQVRRLYEPVLRAIFKQEDWPHLQALEICRNFQPIEFPERFVFTGDPWDMQQGRFGVMRCRM